MLLCLSREQRIAYLLGDLLRFTDTDGARICDISPATFRQRLARARATTRELMGQRCCLVRASNPCRCDKLLWASVDAGILDPDDPRWARHGGVTLPIDTPPHWTPPLRSWTWPSRWPRCAAATCRSPRRRRSGPGAAHPARARGCST